jgi:hypothetical protein
MIAYCGNYSGYSSTATTNDVSFDITYSCFENTSSYEQSTASIDLLYNVYQDMVYAKDCYYQSISYILSGLLSGVELSTFRWSFTKWLILKLQSIKIFDYDIKYYIFKLIIIRKVFSDCIGIKNYKKRG